MAKNYIQKLIIPLFIILFGFTLQAQTFIVQQADASSWIKTVAAGEQIAFPTAASGPSTLTFRILNQGPGSMQLTGSPAVAISGANASNFTVTQPLGTNLSQNQLMTFTITYLPVTATISTAQISIATSAPGSPFIFNLKGAPFDLYGPVYPPFGTISTDSNGTIGRPGGKNLLITNVSMGTQTGTYWGPEVNSNGSLQIKVSLNDGNYEGFETLTYSGSESNLPIGKAVWRGQTNIQNAINGTMPVVYIRATLTTKKPDNSVIPLTDPATLGLSSQIGGLVPFTALSDYLVANYFIEASLDQSNWQPYLDFYDAYPTPAGPLPGQGVGNAYSTVSNGFYWYNFKPAITQNQTLTVAEGGTAAITTSFLNSSDREDMPAHPDDLVFSFQTGGTGTNPLVFETGVLKLNGTVLTKTDTFTLQDIQNGLLTYQHNGDETIYDEFQFSLVDSKNKLAQDGPNSVFSFRISITPVNDIPVADNLEFTTSYIVPFIESLTVTDPDSSAFTYAIVTQPTQGTISAFNPATGEFTYTPASGGPANDSFTYTVNDGTTTSSNATVTIHLINLPPAGTAQEFTTPEDIAVSGNLSAPDPEGTAVTYQLSVTPASGTAVVNTDGSFVYTPDLAAYGTDSFTYTATDAAANASGDITITINVRPRLDPGDLIVADERKLYHYDPSTSQSILLSENQGLNEAINVAYKKNAGLFVYDKTNGLIRVDAYTGVQSLVSPASNFASGGPIGGPAGMLVTDANTIIICDSDGIHSVDIATGNVTPVFSGGSLTYPTGMVYLDNGDVLVSDAGLITGGSSKILRITPAGVQSTVSSGNNIVLPLDIVLIDQNTLIVTDAAGFAGGTDKIYTIDIASGSQTVLSTGGNIAIPSGIDFFEETVYAVNKEGTKLVLGIDATTGVQTIVPGPSLTNPWGLLVIPQSIVIDNTSITNTTCTASTDGEVLIAFSGGTAPYTYTFNGDTATAVSPITITDLTAGSYTVVITDDTGATGTASFTIGTQPDITYPLITAPGNVVADADAGSCEATVATLGTPTFSDNCTGATVSNDAPASFPIGNTTVTWTVTDAAGNTATATQTVTVEDNEDPVINAPGNIIVNNDAGNCEAATVTLGNPVFSDNCTGATVANDAPATFSPGNTTVTWTVTDAAGNTATATQTVTVEDNEDPLITAPGNVITNSDAGSCEAATVTLGTPVYSDNCTGATVANNAPTTFPIGDTTVTWTVTDAAGNTATATQTVTVEDNENPVITAPANITANTDAGSCSSTTVALGTPVFSDNCTGATVSNDAPATFPIGNTTVTWTVTDAAGNTATATQTVTVEDNEDPQITAPGNVIANSDAGSCEATAVTLGTPVFSDNCTGATVANDAPATFPIGDTTVTWTVTDAAGNTMTATQTVTVEDNEDPVITAPGNVIANSDAGSCGNAAITLGAPVLSDNCTGATVANDAPATFPIGDTTITWTVTDAAGNTATATQTVTVEDNEDPVITAPANVTANTDTGSCDATTVALGTPVFSDNCTGATVSNDAPATFPIGNTTVTWTVTDAAGNTATATQTVTIEDNENPVITAPANIIANADAGSCNATGITLGTPVFSDNCTGSTITNNAPAIFPIGSTTVTWTVTDAAGNASTAMQTVTVEDHENPTITAPANIVANTGANSCTANPPLGTPTITDNCASASVITNNAPASFPIGTTAVTWTVTDAGGNTATATQTVTIEDHQVPTIFPPGSLTIPADIGSCSATGVNLGNPIISDNCTGVTATNNAPGSFPIGITIVTWTVSDPAGNTATATQSVVVQDTQAPVLTVPPPVTVNVSPDSCFATGVNLGSATASDNCIVIVQNNATASYPIGVTTVTWMAYDTHGNTTTATQTVTVLDNQAPHITAPASITVAGTENCSVSGLALGNPVAIDNCPGITVTNDAPEVFTLGQTVVTWTVTDAGGNTATSAQTVTVTAPAALVAESSQSFCYGATAGAIVAEGENVVWYDAETDGNIVGNDALLEDDTTYYGVSVHSGCESETRTAVHITLFTTPTPVGEATQHFCNEAMVVDLVTEETVLWYADEDSTTPLDPELLLEDGTIYYAAYTDPVTGCESAVRLAVTAMVHEIPLAEGKPEYVFCNTTAHALSEIAQDFPGGVWYADEDGEEPLALTTLLENNMSYFVRIKDTSTGCESPGTFEVQAKFIGCEVVGYNYLTPNGNDENEFLDFKNITNFPQNNLQIYNRQGKKLYETSSYGQNGNYFDGRTDSGSDSYLPTGTYYYVLEYLNTITGQTNVIKGFFYINNNE